MTLPGMDAALLNNKRVIIRADLNVPYENAKILNDARLRAIVPTLQLMIKSGARTLLLSHLGRPKEGQFDTGFSLEPLATPLSKLLNHPIRFEKNWLQGVSIAPGEIVLGENVRFNKGEEACDESLSKQMASLCDVFVMDAFASAHRAHASTVGVAKFAPVAVAGPLLSQEMAALSNVLKNPNRPLLAIVGGAKISTKLPLLHSLLKQVDHLIVGGGIANTLLAAKGYNIGSSLYEANCLREAKKLVSDFSDKIHLPVDVVLAKEITVSAVTRTASLQDIKPDEKILDIGSQTIVQYSALIQSARTLLWNGPVGVFEIPSFSEGTASIAQAIAQNAQAFSVAGGGETLAAIESYGIAGKLSYISTGGGAFLEYLEGKSLPGIRALEEK